MIISNMATPNKSTLSQDTIESFCDGGIVVSLCALILVLPVSIAFLDSFAALAVFFYFFKKINRIVVHWPTSICRGLAPPENVLNLPLQFLSLAVFISVLFSQYPMLSFLAFFGKFLKSVFLYFSFIEAFRNDKRIRLFLNFFLAAAFITVLDGVFQHYAGRDLLKGHLIAGGRVNAFFFSANGLGAYLLPVTGLVTHLLFTAITRHRSWMWQAGLAFFVVLLLACLCWTYSRSAFIGYLIILLMMVLLDRRKLLFAGALLLVFIFIFLPSLNNVRHLYLINDNNGGNAQNQSVNSILEDGGSGRVLFWTKAVSIIQSSPIYGTGLNTYGRILKRNPNQRTWWYAHNCYLQMTAEIGLLGLSCFLWMVFVVVVHGFNYCKQIKDSWMLALLQGSLAGLFGFMVQSFFDNTFYTVQLGVFMWLLFGLTVAVTRYEQ